MNGALPATMPGNEGFYHAAYVIGAVVYLGYALSLWLRSRRARARLDDLSGGAHR